LFLLNSASLLTYTLFEVGIPIEESPFEHASVPVLGLLFHSIMIISISIALFFVIKKNGHENLNQKS